MANFILADNQEVTRYALENYIRKDESNTVCRAIDKVALTQRLRDNENSVVVLDYALFDIGDINQLIVLSERFSMARWLLFSSEMSHQFLNKVLYSSHQFSVVFKDDSIKDIREALQTAAAGQRFVSQQAMEQILARRHSEEKADVLTATEIEIVRAIAKGKTTKEIAEERFSSVHTITTHRKNIFRKLGVNTAHEAIKYGIRAGWISTSEFYI